MNPRVPLLTCPARPAAVVLLLAAACAGAHAAESRLPIHAPITIGTSGTYVLTRDLDVDFQAIAVDAATVTLDLNGHVLRVGNSGDGIVLRNGATAEVVNGHILGGARAVVVEDAQSGTSRLTLRGVTISGARNAAIEASGVAALSITDSTIRGHGTGIWVGGTARPSLVRITGNALETTGRAIEILGGASQAGGLIAGNVIRAETDAGIVLVGGAAGLSVHDNTVSTGVGTGIYAGGRGGHHIQANVVRDTAGTGIQVPSDGNRIAGNVVSGAGLHGIEVTGHDNVLEGNQCTSNAGYGLAIPAGGNVYRNTAARGNASGQYSVETGNTDAGGNL